MPVQCVERPMGRRSRCEISEVRYDYDQVFSSRITEGFERREVSVISRITLVFEVIFLWSKIRIFSSACGALSSVNRTMSVLTNL